MEKTIKSEVIYNGKVVKLRKDEVLCSNNKTSIREIIDHSGGVATLAFLNNQIILIKQFRYAYQEELYEIPAGKIEKGEKIELAGRRELEEETGYKANKYTYLGAIYPSCGYTNEIIHLYLANDLVQTKTHFDEDEDISTHLFSLEQVQDMINKGKIKDAKTIASIYFYLAKKD